MMKQTIKLIGLPILIAGLGLILASRVTAQTFTTLHGFTELNLNSSLTAWTNNDGANPQASLVLSGQTLYGTSAYGCNSGSGSVFAINTDGTGFTNLYSFTATAKFPYGINIDGANPVSGLVLSGNVLYGTASQGGCVNYPPNGTVFAINTDGTGFVKLHSFTGGDGGANPVAGLVLSGSRLYGTTAGGGSWGDGMGFAINTDGTGFTNLHSFNWSNDGAHPVARLNLSGNTLYGTTQDGGSSGYGIVFKVNTDGTGFTNLHSFTAGDDGANPEAGLILSDNILYGTTGNYGSSGSGTVFAINTDGTGFTNLYSFTTTAGPPYTNIDGVNLDGAFPESELILSGHTLYGTTCLGGSSGNGTVFAVNTDGTGFMSLYSFKNSILPYNPDIDGGFPTNSDGARPLAGLILSDNALYGTAMGGGSSGTGTIFKLSFAPQLTIIASGANVILAWPTNVAGFDYSGFTLQSTTNLVSSAVWSTVSSGPVVVNMQNTVTNSVSGTQKFFRLSQ